MTTYVYPPTTPTWIITSLNHLSSTTQLLTIPPQILAAICKFTSNYGLDGIGINSSGFGGYFGQHETWTYHGVKFTRAELLTSSQTQFAKEAIVAAKTLAGYNRPLQNALAEYVSGNPTNTNTSWVLAVLEITKPRTTQSPAPTESPTVTTIINTINPGVTIMSVSIGTGIIAATGIAANTHKLLFTVPIATRVNAAKYSIIDMGDLAVGVKVLTSPNFKG